MNKKGYELYQKTKANPTGLRFKEIVSLCNCAGMMLSRISRSHYVFRLDRPYALQSIQKMKDGKAKPYQVKQVLGVIEENGLDVME